MSVLLLHHAEGPRNGRRKDRFECVVIIRGWRGDVGACEAIARVSHIYVSGFNEVPQVLFIKDPLYCSTLLARPINRKFG